MQEDWLVFSVRMRLLLNTDKQRRRDIKLSTWIEGSIKIPSYRRRGLLKLMLSFRGVFWLLSGLVALANSKSSAGDSVLVVVEPNHRDNYSIFFDGLKGELPRVVFGACH